MGRACRGGGGGDSGDGWMDGWIVLEGGFVRWMDGWGGVFLKVTGWMHPCVGEKSDFRWAIHSESDMACSDEKTLIVRSTILAEVSA